MPLGAFQKVQVLAIINHLDKYPAEDRRKMFAMITERFCIGCGNVRLFNVPGPCQSCGTALPSSMEPR